MYKRRYKKIFLIIMENYYGKNFKCLTTTWHMGPLHHLLNPTQVFSCTNKQTDDNGNYGRKSTSRKCELFLTWHFPAKFIWCIDQVRMIWSKQISRCLVKIPPIKSVLNEHIFFWATKNPFGLVTKRIVFYDLVKYSN